MIEITVTGKQVNFEALNETLQTEFGDLFGGMSTADTSVTAFLSDEASDEQQNKAKQLIQAHDPSVLTPNQQAQLNLKKDLETLREINKTLSLNLSDVETMSEPMRTIAYKLLWLEHEFRVMTGV